MNVLIFTDVNGVIGFGRYAGSYRIATELRKAGYSTQVIEFLADLSLKDMETVADKYIDEETLFVGFSTTLLIRNTDSKPLERLDRSKQNQYSGHLPQDNGFIQEMFNIFHRKNSKLKIVLGGGRTDNTSLEGVDYWFWGMSDVSIVALADHLKKGSPLKTVEGRVGQVIRAQDYPYHDFEHANIRWEPNDFIFENEHLPIEIARGCIYRCTFCANPLHKKVGEYVRSVSSIREEMLYNYENYKTTGYMFCDDTFNDTHDKVKALHNMITKLPFDIEWTGYGRADVIHSHPEQREMLLETGLKALLIGIETFDVNGSKGVGKGLDPEQMKETLYYIHEAWKGKVVVTGSFIIGLPGESEDSIWKTVEWLQREDCPIDDAIFSPLNIRSVTDNPNAPLSKIARDPAKYGYTIVGPKLGTGISTSGPQWKNKFMDKGRAEELTREIQKIFHKDNPAADWAVYSRLRSMGYSNEELMKTRNSSVNLLEDANDRRQKMFHTYMNKLLQ